MVIFKRKSEKVVDWRYKRQPARQVTTQQSSSDDSQNNLGYLGEMMGGTASNSENSFDSGDDRKKKLAKRIYEMTDKIEDLSNQIYHLQQRIELLEKKTGRSFE